MIELISANAIINLKPVLEYTLKIEDKKKMGI